MKLIYIARDHKGRIERVHDFACREAKAGHRFASGSGFGDVANWDIFEVSSRAEMVENLAGVYGRQEIEDYLGDALVFEPCVTIE